MTYQYTINIGNEHIQYVQNKQNPELFIESKAVAALAKEYQTPLFVYSKQAIVDVVHAYQSALVGRDYQIYYALKANSNLAIIQLIGQQGCGADIVSAGELQRALKAGISPDRIVFSGVGKTASEIRQALLAGKRGIACFNVESIQELELLDKVAQSLGRVAPISLRVNPNIDAKTHPYISTGLKGNKFGIDHEDALSVYRMAKDKKGLAIKGIDCHIGSQITEIEPYLETVNRVASLVQDLEDNGIAIEHIDLGGGWGVQYESESVMSPDILWREILSRLDAHGLGQKKICLEPGRSLVANAGVCVTQVIYTKQGKEKNFCIVDAAMNDLPRPAMYQAYHHIVPVLPQEGHQKRVLYDVVGPICESGDWLARDRELAVQPGDLLAILSAGAYCMSMSSQFNTRARAAELLIDGQMVHTIRHREEIETLWAQERLLS